MIQPCKAELLLLIYYMDVITYIRGLVVYGWVIVSQRKLWYDYLKFQYQLNYVSKKCLYWYIVLSP